MAFIEMVNNSFHAQLWVNIAKVLPASYLHKTNRLSNAQVKIYNQNHIQH